MHSDNSLLPPRLNVRHISQQYLGIDVLRDIGFTVSAGQVHALLGGNGAGKSTFIKIIAEMMPAGTGTLEIDGKRRINLTPAKAHQLGIYLIPQDPVLFVSLSGKENILFGSPARRACSQKMQRLVVGLGGELNLATPAGICRSYYINQGTPTQLGS